MQRVGTQIRTWLNRRVRAGVTAAIVALAVAGAAVELRAQSAVDGKGRIALTKTDAMLMTAHKALFPLKIRTEQPGLFTQGLAFFISRDGYAITQFHPLRGATGATAELPGEIDSIAVDLIAAEPDVDLALIRVRVEDLKTPRELPFIPIADSAPDNGDPVWVLGISKFARPTVDAGTYEAIISHPALPEDTRSALPADHFSHWVQTGAKITLENSGGPLVNNKGQLLGVATYVWQANTGGGDGPSRFVRRDPRGGRDDDNRPSTGQTSSSKGLALSAAHVARILEGREPAPLGFEGANKRYGASPTIFSRLPRIDTAPVPVSALRSAANTFGNAAVCPLCKGEGEILVEVRKETAPTLQAGGGNQQVDPRTGRPYNSAQGSQQAQDQEPPMKECTRCKGSGFQHAEQVLKLGANVVEALARTDMTNREAQRAVVDLNIQLTDVLRHNPQRLIEQLNNQARMHLHPRVMAIGQPVIFLGSMDDRATMPGKRGQLRSAMLGDTGPMVFIAEPDLADANPRDVVLCGGILAGYMTNDIGEPIPVLQRGFIVGIPTTDEFGQPLDEEEQAENGRNDGRGGSTQVYESSDPRERFRAFMAGRRWGGRR